MLILLCNPGIAQKLPITGIFLKFLSVNQPVLKLPVTHMLFFIRFCHFSEKQNAEISVSLWIDIRLSQK